MSIFESSCRNLKNHFSADVFAERVTSMAHIKFLNQCDLQRFLGGFLRLPVRISENDLIADVNAG